MRTPEVDASAEPAATDIANKIANLVGFLRRFASMISGGDNADRLQDAAALIEDLVDALDRERKEFRDVDTRLMQTVRAHAVAQVEIGSATAELSVLQNEMASNGGRQPRITPRSSVNPRSSPHAPTRPNACCAKPPTNWCSCGPNYRKSASRSWCCRWRRWTRC